MIVLQVSLFLSEKLLLTELLDVLAQLRLEVCSLVLVDDVNLSQLVQSLLHAWVHCDSLFLVCCSTKLANCVTHCLSVVAVVKSSLLLLTDSLE